MSVFLATPSAFYQESYLPLVVPGEAPPAAVDPAGEVVVAYGPASQLELCDFAAYSPFFRKQPRHIHRAMMLAPPVKSSLSALKSTVLSGGFQLTPAVAPDDDEPDSEQQLSLKILEECKRSTARMERPLEAWAWEMLDAMAVREKLSETVLEPILAGPDQGLYGFSRLATKPHWAYRYRVDRAMNVRAIDCWTVENQWKSLEPEHFSWLSWEPEDGDPRGSSLLDAAFHAFNMLMQLWPEFYEGNKSFGSPRTFATTGDPTCTKAMVTPRDAKGQEIPGSKPVTAEYALSFLLSRAKNNATVVATYGADAKVLESTRDQAGMNAAIELLEAQILVCIVLQTRATREAQHGSKADSESGTGVLTTFAQFCRQLICQTARRPYFSLVKANYDEDIARRHTPQVSLGKIDPRNFAAIAQAIGLLYQSGYFTEAQLLWLDAYLGMPQRLHGAPRVGPQKDNAGAGVAGADPAARSILKSITSEVKDEARERGMPG